MKSSNVEILNGGGSYEAPLAKVVEIQPVVEKEQIDYIGRYTNEKSAEFLQCFFAPELGLEPRTL